MMHKKNSTNAIIDLNQRDLKFAKEVKRRSDVDFNACLPLPDLCRRMPILSNYGLHAKQDHTSGPTRSKTGSAYLFEYLDLR